MDFFYNILVTGCSSGLGKALFNEVHSHDHLRAFAHYRSMTADPFALYGDVNDSNFPDKLDEFIRTRQIECFINDAREEADDVLGDEEVREHDEWRLRAARRFVR